MDISDCLRAPISESRLRDLSIDISKIFKNSSSFLDGNSLLLHDFVSALLTTAAIPGLKQSHRIAACNVLCGSLEQCSSSEIEEIRSIAISTKTCDELLDIFLDRYESAKAKSMKQVLTTLIRLISKATKIAGNSILRNLAVHKQLKVLFHSLDHVKAKPALHGLTLFLSRNLINRREVLDIFSQLHKHTSDGIHSDSYLVAFLDGIFAWISYQDVAPAVGQLLSKFLEKELEDNVLLPSKLDKREQVPVWAVPLIRCVQQNFDNIQPVKNYVFPSIFKSSMEDYWQFLRFLQIEESLGLAGNSPANVSRHGLSQNHRNVILFSSLQIGKDLDLVREGDTSCNDISVTESHIHISDMVLSRLLDNKSQLLRIAGLELLLNSPSLTRPFTRATLRSLEHHLPHILSDVDANFRGEVHSLLKLFIDRLRSITCNMSRNLEPKKHTSLSSITAEDCSAYTDEQRNFSHLFSLHKKIIHGLLRRLKSELHPNASYQSHTSALRGLILLMMSGIDTSVHEMYWSKQAKGDIRWPFNITIFNGRSRRALLDLILDPFDDVRQFALTILKMIRPKFELNIQVASEVPAYRPFEHFENTSSLSRTLSRCRDPELSLALHRAYGTMLQSGRIDHADGMGRLFDLFSVQPSTSPGDQLAEIISSLEIAESIVEATEDAIHIAERSLAIAVAQQPIHGLFISLRYVLDSILKNPSCTAVDSKESTKLLCSRIYNILQKIWICVQPLLCNDAPEGYMPIEIEDQAEITTRDVLSYAWRALKESSLLLRTAMVFDLSYNCDLSTLKSTSLEDYGDLCFTQLSELRHRGAFSTVSQTFALVCEKCSTSKAERNRALLGAWYQRILNLIAAKGSVITRRSAGIPALIVAVLSADKSGELFDAAIEDLVTLAQVEVVAISRGEVELPQVHTLNSLKAIFTSPKLAERSERHIVRLLKLAATNISSNTWAIRNCCLMLFRSLIDRLLGSHESMDDATNPKVENNSRLAYENYPGLVGLLLDLLSKIQSTIDVVDADGDAESDGNQIVVVTETAFPVLDLLRRAAPPNSERARIQELVISATSAGHWHVRNMAARTYASLVPQNQLEGSIRSCLNFESDNANSLHGRLLCVLQMLKTYAQHNVGKSNYEQLEGLFRSVCSSECEYRFTHPVLKSAWLQILNVLGSMALKFSYENSHAPQTSHTLNTSMESVVNFHNYCENWMNDVAVEAYDKETFPLMRRLSALNHIICQLLKSKFHTAKIEPSGGYKLDLQFDSKETSSSILTFEALVEISSLLDINTKRSLILDVCALHGACPTADFRATAEQLLVSLLNDSIHLKSIFTWSDVIPALKSLNILDSLRCNSSPISIEANVELWGYCLCSKWYAEQDMDDLETETRSWMNVLHSSLDSYEEFPIRYAAACSARNFSTFKRAYEVMPTILQVKFVFIISDILVDDDDEIREIGAEVVLSICKDDNGPIDSFQHVIPPVAADMLSEYISRSFDNSPSTLREALCRLLCQSWSEKQRLISVRSIISRAMTRDTSLFNKEKQNLYINETRETYYWSTLLRRLGPCKDAQKIIEVFEDWTLDGVDVLTDIAERHYDGPLGWSSSPDAFALGMRVLCAAEILLHWHSKSTEVECKSSTIHKKLGKLNRIGLQSNVHGLWLQKINDILLRSTSEEFERLNQPTIKI